MNPTTPGRTLCSATANLDDYDLEEGNHADCKHCRRVAAVMLREPHTEQPLGECERRPLAHASGFVALLLRRRAQVLEEVCLSGRTVDAVWRVAYDYGNPVIHARLAIARYVDRHRGTKREAMAELLDLLSGLVQEDAKRTPATMG